MTNSAPDAGAERTALSTLMMIQAHARSSLGKRSPMDAQWVIARAEEALLRARRFDDLVSATQGDQQPDPKP